MKKTAVLGMYLAFAMILSYIEVLIPLPIPIPGIKLGLANLAIILILYLYGFKEALLINVVRIILIGLLFTNVSMILYSLAGGLLSLALPITLDRFWWLLQLYGHMVFFIMFRSCFWLVL